jgi:putative transposase
MPHRPTVSIPELIKEIKVESNEFVNKKGWVQSRFAWQEGYGAFSYGQSQIDTVCAYIENQEVHHQKKTFRNEYIDLLNKFNIEFEEQYLFDFHD